MEIYIYGLSDPEFRIIRYIGKTTDPYKRENEHNNRSLDLPIRRWIEELKRTGKEPYMEIIEECDENNWLLRERYLIKKFDTQQNSLLNIRSRYSWGNEIFIMYNNATFYRKPVQINRKKTYAVIVKFENGQHWMLKGNQNGYYYLSVETGTFKLTRKHNLYKIDISDLPLLEDHIPVFSDFYQVINHHHDIGISERHIKYY